MTSAATNLNTRLPSREGSQKSAVFLVQKRERTEKTAYHGREPGRHRCGDESGRSEPLHDLSDHVESEAGRDATEDEFTDPTKAEEP